MPGGDGPVVEAGAHAVHVDGGLAEATDGRDAAADDATGRRGQFAPEVFTQAPSRDPSACGFVRDDVALVRRLVFLFLGSSTRREVAA